MSPNLQNALQLAARALLALLFIPAGISKIGGFEGTVGYIASVGLPLATVGAVVAVVVEIVGGLALLAGLATRSAALALAVFTLVASVFFHAFWSLPADQVFVNQLMFFKNLAIVGGLLAVAAQGGGAWSLDARRAGKVRAGGLATA